RRIFDRAWENGLVIRAFGNGVLVYAPPLCCTETEIDAIVELTRITLDETLEDPDVPNRWSHGRRRPNPRPRQSFNRRDR
ncbi:hypothetical protein ACC719_36400, partial [Rhizobium ruizarguesonis]